MKTLPILLLIICWLGCNTEECKQLTALKTQYEGAIAEAKARAALKKQTLDRMTKFEAAAKETMAQLGLDLPETKLQETLDERLKKIPGATLERTTKAITEFGDEEGAINETLWRIEYAAKSDGEAFERMRMVAERPPLFSVITLLKDSKGKWLLELLRTSVVEVSTNIKPLELPPLKSPEEVQSTFGFCGSGALRSELAAMEKEWLTLKVQAEELTVVMPKIATYEGLQRRAELAGKLEDENRRLIESFVTATEKAKVRYRAVGVERGIVIFEFFGGAAERGRVEKFLPEDVVKGIKELDSANKGVIRLSVVNRVADQQIKHRRGLGVPGVGLAPEKGE